MEKKVDLAVIVPAFNEEKTIKDTILSLKAQSKLPKKIIVVDDHSTDKTYEVVSSLGVRLIRTPSNTGSKAGAQNYALKFCDTEFVMALDADTILKKDAIEKLYKAFDNDRVAAACGFVIPRYINTLWERGRFIEYLLAFTYYKPIQDYFGKPLISSGCFSMYRARFLKETRGWPTRTMAEDMDLTWSFHKREFFVRFIPDAVCYPIEPQNFTFMSRQLKRWSHGFLQNLLIHWKDVATIPHLNFIIAVTSWDAIVATFIYLFVVPTIGILHKDISVLLLYFIDAPIIFIPVLFKSISLHNVEKMIRSFPYFFILRIVNAIFMIEAFWSEIILRRRLTSYEKGGIIKNL